MAPVNRLERGKATPGTPVRINNPVYHARIQLASTKTLIPIHSIEASCAGDLTAFIPVYSFSLSIKAPSVNSPDNRLCRHICRLALNDTAHRRALG